MHYSLLSLLRQSVSGHQGWTPAWRNPEPKPAYDIVIVGAGHGLATAYYLAKEHGARNIAVLEKGWLGSGNIGRNTTIIRSNYLLPGNGPFYEWSLKLWEGLEQDFNFNAMVSQRGVLNLFHSDAQRDAAARRGNAIGALGMPSVLGALEGKFSFEAGPGNLEDQAVVGVFSYFDADRFDAIRCDAVALAHFQHRVDRIVGEPPRRDTV